jgi:hypothetical protein
VSVGDEEVDGSGNCGVYETRVSGSTATPVRTAELGGSQACFQWANDSSKPNDLPAQLDKRILAASNVSLYEWSYPAGGNPLGQFVLSAGGTPLASLLVRVR